MMIFGHTQSGRNQEKKRLPAGGPALDEELNSGDDTPEEKDSLAGARETVTAEAKEKAKRRKSVSTQEHSRPTTCNDTTWTAAKTASRKVSKSPEGKWTHRLRRRPEQCSLEDV